MFLRHSLFLHLITWLCESYLCSSIPLLGHSYLDFVKGDPVEMVDPFSVFLYDLEEFREDGD